VHFFQDGFQITSGSRIIDNELPIENHLRIFSKGNKKEGARKAPCEDLVLIPDPFLVVLPLSLLTV
jgi:hypothetical protein